MLYLHRQAIPFESKIKILYFYSPFSLLSTTFPPSSYSQSFTDTSAALLLPVAEDTEDYRRDRNFKTKVELEFKVHSSCCLIKFLKLSPVINQNRKRSYLKAQDILQNTIPSCISFSVVIICLWLLHWLLFEYAWMFMKISCANILREFKERYKIKTFSFWLERRQREQISKINMTNDQSFSGNQSLYITET